MSTDELCDLSDGIIYSAYWYRVEPWFRWAECPLMSYVIYLMVQYTLRTGIEWSPGLGGQSVH